MQTNHLHAGYLWLVARLLFVMWWKTIIFLYGEWWKFTGMIGKTISQYVFYYQAVWKSCFEARSRCPIEIIDTKINAPTCICIFTNMYGQRYWWFSMRAFFKRIKGAEALSIAILGEVKDILQERAGEPALTHKRWKIHNNQMFNIQKRGADRWDDRNEAQKAK